MQNEQFLKLSNSTLDNGTNDNLLWEIAKRRAGFKISSFAYVAVNIMLIAIWYFTTGEGSYFWPIWPLLGWGIGIAAQYFHAYHHSNLFSIKKEYEKLKNQHQN